MFRDFTIYLDFCHLSSLPFWIWVISGVHSECCSNADFIKTNKKKNGAQQQWVMGSIKGVTGQGVGGCLLADFVGQWTSDRETCIIHLPKNPNQFFALVTVKFRTSTVCVCVCECVRSSGGYNMNMCSTRKDHYKHWLANHAPSMAKTSMWFVVHW